MFFAPPLPQVTGPVLEDDSTASAQSTGEYLQAAHTVNWELPNVNSRYVAISDVQHVYLRPGVYVGDMEPVSRMVHAYNAGEFGQVNILMCEGLIRLFLEAITNAGDNVERSREAGIDPGKIYIRLRPDRITVRNGGDVIPIEKHPQFPEDFNPFVVFGNLRTSSNYKGSRRGAGINGLGIKLVNIFSNEFTVDIGDPIRQLRYQQQWTMNMRNVSPPVIEPYTGEPYVQVTYLADFSRFYQGMTGYSTNDLLHFAWLAASTSMTKKVLVDLDYLELSTVPVVQADGSTIMQQTMTEKLVTLNFTDTYVENGVPITRPLRGIETYSMAIYQNKMPKQELPPTEVAPVAPKAAKPKGFFGRPAKTVERLDCASFSIPSTEGYSYLAEVVLLNTPGDGSFIAFTNGPLPQSDGGEHVNAFYKAFGDPLLQSMKDQLEKIKKTMDDSSGLNRVITISHVKKNISMVLSIQIVDPDFGGGQNKTKLSSFRYNKITVPARVNRIISNWALGKELKALLEARFKTELKKTDGGRGQRVYMKSKLRRANDAGTAQSLQCALWVTEGDSGMEYLVNAMEHIPGGWDKNGVMPARGKLINPLNNEEWKLARNKEYAMLKDAAGLREGVDGQEALPHLNYGRIILAADADFDGSHIKGLALNILWRWPKLVAMGFVYFLRTPIKRVNMNGQPLSLYTTTHIERFLAATNNGAGLEIFHCKGLGSSSPEEVARDMQNPYIVMFVADQYAHESIHLLFDNEYIDKRKLWMANRIPMAIEDSNAMTITDFINTEMAEFSAYNLRRGVPNVGGHKPSILKILYAAVVLRWKYKTGDFVRVSQLQGYVSEKVIYHHGEDSLGEAIVGMAQDYPGSNNLPYFEGKGQFGSRDANGKNHAKTRYLNVKPSWWLFKVFREEDQSLLEVQMDDGLVSEPVYMLSTIPLIAINGVTGIGTGWGTEIPGHHPIQVCELLKDIIRTGQINPASRLEPWYRGFRGNNVLIQKKKKGVDMVYTFIDGMPGLNLTTGSAPKMQLAPVNSFYNAPLPLDPENAFAIAATGEHPQQEAINRIAAERFGNSTVYDKDNYLASFGHFFVEDNTIVIDEIPIFTSIQSYDRFLDDLKFEGIIMAKKNRSKANEPRFVISGMQSPSYDVLKLMERKSMSNMTYLDEFGRPRQYKRIEDIIYAFYLIRLPYYQKRKDMLVANCKKQIGTLKLKLLFTQLVNRNMVEVRNRNREAILADLVPYQIPSSIYDSVKVHNLNLENEPKMANKIASAEAELTRLESLVPQEMWIKDIDDFMVSYNRHYKE